MITVCLDEKRTFEGRNANKTYLGGFYYIDKGPDDLNNEKERICCFFSKICNEVKTNYPRDLHEQEKATRRQRTNVNITKNRYIELLPEFMKKGTYCNDELLEENRKRKGTYNIFLMSYDRNNSSRGYQGVFDDNNGTNRYLHMAEDLLNNIFIDLMSRNILTNVSFDLPTRSLPKNNVVTEGLGHDFTPFSNEERNRMRIAVTNNTFYNAIIDNLVQTYKDFPNWNKRIKIESDVNSFDGNYNLRRDNIEEQQKIAFHYLADAVCSYFNYIDLPGLIEQQKRLLDGNPLLCWCYGGINQIYTEVKALIWNKQYIEAFGKISDFYKLNKNPKPKEFEHYKKNWIKPIEKELIDIFKEMTPREIKILAADINEVTFTPEVYQRLDGLEIGSKCLKEVLEEKLKNNTQNNVLVEALFYIYDTIISVYNHKGCAKESIEYIRKIDEIKENMIDTHLIISRKNRYLVPFIDVCIYDEAFIQARDAYVYAKYKRGSEEKARALSQFAQITETISESNCSLLDVQLTKEQLAYNKKLIPRHFEKALEIWGEDQDNYRETLCFYLHYFIEEACKNPDKRRFLGEKYKKWAVKYFYKKTTEKNQKKALLNNGIKEPFALHLWLKGLVAFYEKDEIKKIISEQDIKNILAEFSPRHPWESIVLYSCELWWLISEPRSDDSVKKILNSLLEKFYPTNRDNIIGCLVEANRIAFLEYIGATTIKKSCLKNRLRKLTNNRLPREDCKLIDTLFYTYR